MDTRVENQSASVLRTLRKLFPKTEMNRVLDDVAGNRLPPGEFKTFVWHTMAKMVAQKVAGRPWERVDGDLRHQATQMSVIYAMHCVYERSAKGRSDFTAAGRSMGQRLPNGRPSNVLYC